MITESAKKSRVVKSSEISEIKKEQAKRLLILALGAGFTSQADLAAATGINFRTIGSYWCGHRRITDAPPDMYASRIVEAINTANPKRKTTVTYLLLGEGPMYVTESAQSAQNARKPLRIRLFFPGDAEYLLRLKKNESFAWSKEIAIMDPDFFLGSNYTDASRPLPIFFTVQDRSMEPLIPLDSKVVVPPDETYVAGDLVLACPPGMEIAIIRQYQIKQKARAKMRRILHPLNDAGGAFEDLEIDDCNCIIGPVKLIISKPR